MEVDSWIKPRRKEIRSRDKSFIKNRTAGSIHHESKRNCIVHVRVRPLLVLHPGFFVHEPRMQRLHCRQTVEQDWTSERTGTQMILAWNFRQIQH